MTVKTFGRNINTYVPLETESFRLGSGEDENHRIKTAMMMMMTLKIMNCSGRFKFSNSGWGENNSNYTSVCR